MTVLVLIGPAATQPVELARRVAESRPLTAVIDVAGLVTSLEPVRGADAETKHLLGIDLATAMATRLSEDGVHAIVAEATRQRSTAVYRDGLLFAERVTFMALTADPERLALRDFGRGPEMLTGLRAWRTWRQGLDELRSSVPTFTDYDVILDCADRSRADLVRLISAAL